MKFEDNIFQTIGSCAEDLKNVVFAKKLAVELQSADLEQVLASYLPASDANRLREDAAGLAKGVDDLYASLDQAADDAWVAAQLNTVLAGRSAEKQGSYLVRLLKCSTAVLPDAVMYDSRWPELAEAETFTEDDVAELLDITKTCLHDRAGYLARQEYQVMVNILDKLPEETAAAQLDSGKRDSLARAAAVYISNAKTNAAMRPYQIGLTAAEAVESSKLLALYHSGKLHFEALLPALEALAKKALVLASKAVLRALAVGAVLTMGMLVGDFFVDIISLSFVLSTGAILAVHLVSIAASFLAYPVKDMEEDLLNLLNTVKDMAISVWNGVKNLVSKVAAFFSGDGPDPKPDNAVIIDDTLDESYRRQLNAPVSTNPIIVN